MNQLRTFPAPSNVSHVREQQKAGSRSKSKALDILWFSWRCSQRKRSRRQREHFPNVPHFVPYNKGLIRALGGVLEGLSLDVNDLSGSTFGFDPNRWLSMYLSLRKNTNLTIDLQNMSWRTWLGNIWMGIPLIINSMRWIWRHGISRLPEAIFELAQVRMGVLFSGRSMDSTKKGQKSVDGDVEQLLRDLQKQCSTFSKGIWEILMQKPRRILSFEEIEEAYKTQYWCHWKQSVTCTNFFSEKVFPWPANKLIGMESTSNHVQSKGNDIIPRHAEEPLSLHGGPGGEGRAALLAEQHIWQPSWQSAWLLTVKSAAAAKHTMRRLGRSLEDWFAIVFHTGSNFF